MENFCYLSRVEILFFGGIPVNMINRLNWHAVLNVIVVVSYFFSAPNGSSICPTREIKVTVDSPEKLKGALYSPGFPNYYPPNQNCTVTLDVPDNFKTIVWFQSFFLQCKNVYEYPFF